MGAFDFLLKKESALDSLDAGYAFGDIDMVLSERDGSLVPVDMENGVHVCQQCREQFVDDRASPLRMVEFSCGGEGVRIGLHSKCVRKAQAAIEKRGDRGGGLVFDMSKMSQARRFLSRATKPFRKGDAG